MKRYAWLVFVWLLCGTQCGNFNARHDDLTALEDSVCSPVIAGSYDGDSIAAVAEMGTAANDLEER
jgi:hypothetical protein